MALYRRRLPHDYETDQPVFLTWRLHDSLPRHRAFPVRQLSIPDRHLPPWIACWLKPVLGRFSNRRIADMVAEAIQYHAANLEH
jgi:hypothetical protein